MNNYQVYEEIGRGKHSSVVYKGRKKKSVDYFAITSYDKSDRARVLHSVQCLRALQPSSASSSTNHNNTNNNKSNNNSEVSSSSTTRTHPNVLKFYNWYETSNHFWLVMELCTGGTLRDVLQTLSSSSSSPSNKNSSYFLPLRTLRTYTRDLIAGLRYLHSRGIVYNDLTPSNILLDDNEMTLKYYDFANAINCSTVNNNHNNLNNNNNNDDENNNNNSPTNLDFVNEYTAPELFVTSPSSPSSHKSDNKDKVPAAVPSFASDLYSLGSVLFELATGKPAFCCHFDNEYIAASINSNNNQNSASTKSKQSTTSSFRKQNQQNQQQQQQSNPRPFGFGNDQDVEVTFSSYFANKLSDVCKKNLSKETFSNNNNNNNNNMQTTGTTTTISSPPTGETGGIDSKFFLEELATSLINNEQKCMLTCSSSTLDDNINNQNPTTTSSIAVPEGVKKTIQNFCEFILGLHQPDPLKRWDWNRVLNCNFVKQDCFGQNNNSSNSTENNNSNNEAIMTNTNAANNNNNNNTSSLLLSPTSDPCFLLAKQFPLASQPGFDKWLQHRLLEINIEQQQRQLQSSNVNNNNNNTTNNNAPVIINVFNPSPQDKLLSNTNNNNTNSHLTIAPTKITDTVSSSRGNIIIHQHQQHQSNVLLNKNRKHGNDNNNDNNSTATSNDQFTALLVDAVAFASPLDQQSPLSAIKPILHNHRIERIADAQYDADAVFKLLNRFVKQQQQQQASTLLPTAADLALPAHSGLLQAFVMPCMFAALTSGDTSLTEKHQLLCYLESLLCSSSSSGGSGSGSGGDSSGTLIANTVVNSTLVNVIVTMLNMQHVPAALCSLLLTITARLFRFTTFIHPDIQKTRIVDTLCGFADPSAPVKVRRRALAALGELLFYGATSTSLSSSPPTAATAALANHHQNNNSNHQWNFPADTYRVLSLGLLDKDDICKHYCVKTIENLLIVFETTSSSSSSSTTSGAAMIFQLEVMKQLFLQNKHTNCLQNLFAASLPSSSPTTTTTTSAPATSMSKTEHLRLSALQAACRCTYLIASPSSRLSNLLFQENSSSSSSSSFEQCFRTAQSFHSAFLMRHCLHPAASSHRVLQCSLTFVGLHALRSLMVMKSRNNSNFVNAEVLGEELPRYISTAPNETSLDEKTDFATLILQLTTQPSSSSSFAALWSLIKIFDQQQILSTTVVMTATNTNNNNNTTQQPASSANIVRTKTLTTIFILLQLLHDASSSATSNSSNSSGTEPAESMFWKFFYQPLELQQQQQNLSNNNNNDDGDDGGASSVKPSFPLLNKFLTHVVAICEEDTLENTNTSSCNNCDNEIQLLTTLFINSNTNNNENGGENNNNASQDEKSHLIIKLMAKKLLLLLCAASSQVINEELSPVVVAKQQMMNNNNTSAVSRHSFLLDRARKTTVLLNFAANGVFRSLLLDSGEILLKNCFVKVLSSTLPIINNKNNSSSIIIDVLESTLKLWQILEYSDLDFASLFICNASTASTSSTMKVRTEILNSTLALIEICGNSLNININNTNNSTTDEEEKLRIMIRCSALRVLSNIIALTNNNNSTTNDSKNNLQQQQQQQPLIAHLIRKEGKVYEQLATELSSVLEKEMQLLSIADGKSNNTNNNNSSKATTTTSSLSCCCCDDDEVRSAIITSSSLALSITMWFCENSPAFVERVSRSKASAGALLKYANFFTSSTERRKNSSSSPSTSSSSSCFQVLSFLLRFSPETAENILSCIASSPQVMKNNSTTTHQNSSSTPPEIVLFDLVAKPLFQTASFLKSADDENSIQDYKIFFGIDAENDQGDDERQQMKQQPDRKKDHNDVDDDILKHFWFSNNHSTSFDETSLLQFALPLLEISHVVLLRIMPSIAREIKTTSTSTSSPLAATAAKVKAFCRYVLLSTFISQRSSQMMALGPTTQHQQQHQSHQQQNIVNNSAGMMTSSGGMKKNMNIVKENNQINRDNADDDDDDDYQHQQQQQDVLVLRSVQTLLNVCEASAAITTEIFSLDDLDSRSILIQAVCSVEPSVSNNNSNNDLCFLLVKLLLVVLTASDLNVAVSFFQDELMTIKLERLAESKFASAELVSHCRAILAIC